MSELSETFGSGHSAALTQFTHTQENMSVIVHRHVDWKKALQEMLVESVVDEMIDYKSMFDSARGMYNVMMITYGDDW